MVGEEQQPAVVGSLKRFKVAGFRRLLDVDVELGPVNILIGPNGGGKSSFLDAIEMMGRTIQRDLKGFVAEFGGFNQILHSRAQAKQICIEAALNHPESTPTYEVRIGPYGYGHTIQMESFEMNWEAPSIALGRVGGWRFPSVDAAVDLSRPVEDLPHDFLEGDSALKFFYALGNVFSVGSLSTGRRSLVRSAQRVSPIRWQYSDGADLFIRLMEIQQKAPNQFESIVQILKAAFPTFERLELQIVGDSFIGLYWHESGSPQPLSGGQLSDGILCFLWLLALLYHPGCPPVVLLDEPESHFHPKLIQILVEVLRECSAWTQIVATTHSASIVRFLRPEELFVVEPNDEGKTRIQRASNMRIEHWLEDFTLDEIWSLGRLSEWT